MTVPRDRDAYVRVARHAALGEPANLVRALSALEGDADAIVRTLGTHRLIRFLLVTAGPADLVGAVGPALASQLEAWRSKPWIPRQSLVEHFVHTEHVLAANAIPVLLLKGFPFAERVYGHLGDRPQQDVDLLVRARDMARAERTLRRAGYGRQSYDPHGATYLRGELKTDLHWCLRHAPAFRIDENEVWRRAEERTAAGVTCRTLSDEWTLVLLVLASFEELGHGMPKLRALADLLMLARTMDPGTDWQTFFEQRRDEQLDGVVANVLRLVVDLFDAAADVPGLAAALDARRAAVRPLDTPERLDLVFSSTRRAESLRWFAVVYPGSLTHYLLTFWAASFPQNVRRFSLARLLSGARISLAGRHGRHHPTGMPPSQPGGSS